MWVAADARHDAQLIQPLDAHTPLAPHMAAYWQWRATAHTPSATQSAEAVVG